ncbi:uncharacterized protein LOC129210059 [Grus americana]|uniref:uncharacterized protein LOC129210059 n=1 Tax=Grus americana TaxID=9117 RepID=UPI002407BCF4|nr:uncharacterized protein LOC129210059 [Grus americana]
MAGDFSRVRSSHPARRRPGSAVHAAEEPFPAAVETESQEPPARPEQVEQHRRWGHLHPAAPEGRSLRSSTSASDQRTPAAWAAPRTGGDGAAVRREQLCAAARRGRAWERENRGAGKDRRTVPLKNISRLRGSLVPPLSSVPADVFANQTASVRGRVHWASPAACERAANPHSNTAKARQRTALPGSDGRTRGPLVRNALTMPTRFGALCHGRGEPARDREKATCLETQRPEARVNAWARATRAPPPAPRPERRSPPESLHPTSQTGDASAAAGARRLGASANRAGEVSRSRWQREANSSLRSVNPQAVVLCLNRDGSEMLNVTYSSYMSHSKIKDKCIAIR